jgi:hypothetical protein
VSIEAIHWVLTAAPIPRQQRDASTLAVVLIGLANHAGPDGTNAFPSVATLTRYTRLSARSVQYSLRKLAGLGLITPSDPDIVAAHVRRADRRPQGWDLALDRHETHPATAPATSLTPAPGVVHSRGAPSAPRSRPRGALHVARGASSDVTGCTHCTRTILEPSRTTHRPATGLWTVRRPTHRPGLRPDRMARHRPRTLPALPALPPRRTRSHRRCRSRPEPEWRLTTQTRPDAPHPRLHQGALPR